MRDTRILMGMPITVEIVDAAKAERLIEAVYAYFAAVDARFSTFKPDSEISAINQGRVAPADLSAEMREVLAIAARTKRETRGYFEIQRPDGSLDPSGIVKGWAIRNAADLLRREGVANFFVDAGGDIQSSGVNAEGKPWKIGIRSPFNDQEIIKIVHPGGHGIATSGTYVRNQHIYNPHAPDREIDDIVSLTVIGSDVLEADRFATAAFAMGRAGIHFLEAQPDLEGYLVDARGVATQTTGFKAFISP
ncbi:FAD:protein FMN transferase [Kaistia dalseonensis]|uniref:FAD:protein FMN transferase n=1 Tax=Kaistia dalseonensis TaxID=410840 RepID=A0ABU0HD21_9HYPH|nr:FAD:protein FMN transferase [Kaistia dalseonensis]MCX5497536.1 FAD:protein FMN transferase [Kaistia dalseonensis]MDQ0440175.1 thiamine biosynthesis lipoprotein [Kaistia dalseonensis]